MRCTRAALKRLCLRVNLWRCHDVFAPHGAGESQRGADLASNPTLPHFERSRFRPQTLEISRPAIPGYTATVEIA
jgi:hypothetical protein